MLFYTQSVNIIEQFVNFFLDDLFFAANFKFFLKKISFISLYFNNINKTQKIIALYFYNPLHSQTFELSFHFLNFSIQD